MEHIAVLCGFYVLVIFSTGLSVYIQTQETVWAAAGEHVSLSCQLSQSEDVEEVEWRKILSDGEKSLSSSHKLHGRKVNPEFEERMEFRFDGFHDCSVGLKVTEQDKGCYRCVFNTNPEGVLSNRTCLWISAPPMDGPPLSALSAHEMEENQKKQLDSLMSSFPVWRLVSFKEVLPYILILLACGVLSFLCTYLPKLIWKCTCHFVEKIFEEPEV